MSIDNIDFKHYLKKLDLEDVENILSNEDLQNCIQTIRLQSVSSSDIVDVKKLNLSNLKIKSIMKKE